MKVAPEVTVMSAVHMVVILCFCLGREVTLFSDLSLF